MGSKKFTYRKIPLKELHDNIYGLCEVTVRVNGKDFKTMASIVLATDCCKDPRTIEYTSMVLEDATAFEINEGFLKEKVLDFDGYFVGEKDTARVIAKVKEFFTKHKLVK